MNTGKAVLMTHLVSYYPDRERSVSVARAMIDGGASYLEIQFPFSDPSADGPTIQSACSSALESGFTLDGGFGMVRDIRAFSDIPVFLMNYANIPFSKGIECFILRCLEEGISGLIIPDLVPGRDEGLYELGKKHGIPVLPVVVPTISEKRIHEIIELAPEYLYVAMRTGITGRETEIGSSLLSFLDIFMSSGIKVLAGFGVRSPLQVKTLAPHVHGIIVGSALVNEIAAHIDETADALYNAVKKRVIDLIQ